MTQPEALRLADEMERVAEYDHQVQAAAELRRLYKLKHPRQWQGLTDEELAEFSELKLGAYDLCLEVEAKLKEKNT